MPTIISHSIVPLALGLGAGKEWISRRTLIWGLFGSILPDMDVLAFKFGIPYADDFGHRGISHSLGMALIFTLLYLLFNSREKHRAWATSFVLASTLSHGILDMMTNGGMGVEFLWPFSAERYFFPWQFIQVSPIGIKRILTVAGLKVMFSKLTFVWLPLITLGLAIWGWRKYIQILRIQRKTNENNL